MNVFSSGIVNGVIDDKYGKRGAQLNKNGIPTYSLPLKIEDAPEGTKTFAIILEDKDAVPVCGHVWIHWLVANLKRSELAENESQTATDFVQGANSYSGLVGGLERSEMSCYAGMVPPDTTHTYELHVYALDTELDLVSGFHMNELYWAMQGHILAQTTLYGRYAN